MTPFARFALAAAWLLLVLAIAAIALAAMAAANAPELEMML